MILQLAKQEDVLALSRIFETYFSDFREENAGALDLLSLNDVEYKDVVDEDDLGVAYESSLETNQVCINLGIKDGVPALFNSWRHKSGATNWDDAHLFDNGESGLDESVEPLRLKRHQLDAIHAIFRALFPKEPGLTGGVLLADQVGLGKSAVVMGVIAIFAQAFAKKSPPIFRASQCLPTSLSYQIGSH
jgi:TATA-binding protein-associated factor